MWDKNTFAEEKKHPNNKLLVQETSKNIYFISLTKEAFLELFMLLTSEKRILKWSKVG